MDVTRLLILVGGSVHPTAVVVKETGSPALQLGSGSFCPDATTDLSYLARDVSALAKNNLEVLEFKLNLRRLKHLGFPLLFILCPTSYALLSLSASRSLPLRTSRRKPEKSSLLVGNMTKPTTVLFRPDRLSLPPLLE